MPIALLRYVAAVAWFAVVPWVDLMKSLYSWLYKPTAQLCWLLLLSLALRLIVAALTSGAAYDLESYHMQAQSVFTHQNVYTLTDRYPYPPVWVWLVSLAQWGANSTGWPFAWFVKAPGILGDCLIVLLLWKRAGRAAALFYVCNPVSVLITAGHGQFDGLVMALVVGAWALWGRQRQASLVWAPLALGGAIALKGYPLVFLPALIVRASSTRQRLIVTGLALLPLVLSISIYGALFGWALAMLTHVLGYSSYPYFGWALYVDVLIHGLWPASFQVIVEAFSLVARTVMLVLVGWLVWRKREWPLERLWLAIILSIYVLAPGIAVQYFLWALPLLTLIDRRRGSLYTLASLLAMLFFYLTQEPGALPWGTTITGWAPQAIWLSCYVVLNLPWYLWCLWLLRVVLREGPSEGQRLLPPANAYHKRSQKLSPILGLFITIFFLLSSLSLCYTASVLRIFPSESCLAVPR